MPNRIIYLIILLLVISSGVYWWRNQAANKQLIIYNPNIDSADFVARIDNQYFTLIPGTKFIYESNTSEGLERLEVEVLDETKAVLGIKAAVVRDRVWLNGELIEDTKDWYAQDKDGNVWYLGEAVDNYENGQLKDQAGAWQAGVDGAQPGIIMLANPEAGDSYRQEFYQGEAEDMADVVALNQTASVAYGSFVGCLQTRDWSALDKTANEYKYYCPQVGFVVLEEAVGGKEKVELVSLQPASN